MRFLYKYSTMNADLPHYIQLLYRTCLSRSEWSALDVYKRQVSADNTPVPSLCCSPLSHFSLVLVYKFFQSFATAILCFSFYFTWILLFIYSILISILPAAAYISPELVCFYAAPSRRIASTDSTGIDTADNTVVTTKISEAYFASFP